MVVTSTQLPKRVTNGLLDQLFRFVVPNLARDDVHRADNLVSNLLVRVAGNVRPQLQQLLSDTSLLEQSKNLD